MVPTIEMDDESKSLLEEIQTEIKSETGGNVTQQEVLAHIVECVYESKADIIDSFQDGYVPLSEEEREAFHSGMFSSGVETDEEDIDEILYG